MLDLKSKSQFLLVKFSFFIKQKYAKNPMKNNTRWKEINLHPPKGLSLIFHYSQMVFESFGVHLSLIYKKRSEHKANGAKQGEFINNVSKDKEIVGGLFKGK